MDDESMLVRTDVGGPDVLLVMDKDGYIYVDPQEISPDQAGHAPTSAAISTAAVVSQVATPGVVASAPAPSQPAGIPLWLLMAIGGLLTVAVLILSVDRRTP
jgi:hypothetical protein